MSLKIELENGTDFRRLLESSPRYLHAATVEGLHLAMEDWHQRAYKIAPWDIKFLKSEMHTRVDENKLEGTLISNAYKDGFNYAYYLHEIGHFKGLHANVPGTTLRWIDETTNMKPLKIVEAEVERQMKERWR